MTEGAWKTDRGLKSNRMLLIEQGTCAVVVFIMKDRLNIVQKALLMHLWAKANLFNMIRNRL